MSANVPKSTACRPWVCAFVMIPLLNIMVMLRDVGLVVHSMSRHRPTCVLANGSFTGRRDLASMTGCGSLRTRQERVVVAQVTALALRSIMNLLQLLHCVRTVLFTVR